MMLGAFLMLFAAEPSPVTLQPSSKWAVDYGDNTCSAKRSFGTGPDAVTLEFRPQGFNFKRTGIALLIPAEARDGSSGGARLTLQPLGKSIPLTFFPVSDVSPLRSYITPFDQNLAPALTDVATMELRTARQTRTLATGDVKPVLAVLAKCGDDLLHSWGIDGSTMAEPIGSPGDWLTDNDYPVGAMSRRASGKVLLAVTITPAGKVSGCRILMTSGDRDLDLTSCAVVYRRGQFTTSTDSAPRYFIMSTRWIFRG